MLHDVLQAAFEWSDDHLWRFALGGSPFASRSEHFLCPYDVEERADVGLAAHEVRLDETLRDKGDVLAYVYDYGDSWELTLRLESVRPVRPDGALAVCIAGRSAPPREDSGWMDADDPEQIIEDRPPLRHRRGQSAAHPEAGPCADPTRTT